jgi:CDGSH-type Zn-finger protein
MAEPKIAQKAPYLMDVKAGTYFWCACGESKNQPYCDGSHKTTEFTPVKQVIDVDKKVAWCGCKHSKNGSFCDGSHKSI